MLALLADENLNNDIVRGVLRREPAINFQRVQDVGLDGVDDPGVLEWAAVRGMLVVTHDVNTMIAYANERVSNNLIMPGLILVPQQAPLGSVINDLLMLALFSNAEEWHDQSIFLPLPS